MYSAVPATGIVNNDATRATPAHRASGSGNASDTIFQQANSVRNIESTYQMNKARSKGRRETRTEAAISSSNSVRCAWFRKNSAPNGYRDGFRIFLMPGR